MAQSLPSDLYDPVLALQYVAYKFPDNLGVMTKIVSPAANAPVRLNPNIAVLSNGGTVVHAPTLKPIASLVTKRDLTSESDATPLKIESRDDKGVRISAKIGPVAFTQSAAWLSGQPAGVLTEFFAQEAMNKMALHIRDHVLGAAVAAIGNMTQSLHTKDVWSATSRTNLSTALLAQTRQLFGDKIDDYASPGSGAQWVFRSEALADLVQNQLGAGVAGIADRAAGGASPLTLGLPFCLADGAALTTADSGFDKYRTLLLGPGAMELDIVKLEFTPLWMNPKAENVEFVLRGDFDFELRIPGFMWRVATGTNPTLGAVSTTTNWDVTYSDHREVPMAYAQHNVSSN